MIMCNSSSIKVKESEFKFNVFGLKLNGGRAYFSVDSRLSVFGLLDFTH